MNWLDLVKPKIRDRKGFSINVFLLIFLILCFFLAANKYLLNISLETSQYQEFVGLEIVFIGTLILFVVWGVGVFIPFLWEVAGLVTETFPFFPKVKLFLPEDCLNNLIYQGIVRRLGPKEIKITSSDSGALIKSHWWKNFLAEFYFRFEDLKDSYEIDYRKMEGNTYNQAIIKTRNNYFGFIFRAQDLDNYFMLSVGVKNNRWLITPHIRLDGKWEVLKQEPIGRRLTAKKKHKITIEVKDNKLVLKFEELKNFKYKWKLPTNFRSSERDKPISQSKDRFYSFGDESLIYFKNNFGKVGFRAHGDEHVIIKDLKITSL